MTIYRKVAMTYEAVVFDGKNVDELVALCGETRVKVINKGLVNAAPQVIVHAALNSPSIAVGDVVVRGRGAAGKIAVWPADVFAATFEPIDEVYHNLPSVEPMPLVHEDAETGDVVVNVESIAGGVGVNLNHSDDDAGYSHSDPVNVNVTDAEA